MIPDDIFTIRSNPEADPPRILHLVHSLNCGGIENWLLAALRQMPPDEFAMDVCCKGPQTGELAAQAREAGAEVLHCPLGPSVLPFVQGLKHVLRSGRYSLLHVHTQAHSGPAVYAAKAAGVPALVTFHSTQQSPQTPFTRLPGVGAARAIYARRSMRYALLKAAVATGVSTSVVQAATRSAGIAQSRCRVFHLGCERPPRISDKRLSEYRHEFGLPVDAPLIVHVGSMRACKNHEGLLQVLKRVLHSEPDAVLLLVGEGPLRSEIQKRIARLGLDRHVRLLGTRRDATSLMQMSQVFLFPSHYEGLSVALMEALAVGLPIVASDIPGNREATNGDAARLHNVSDIDGMAASTVELLQNGRERERLAEQGRRIYEETFSIEACMERLSNLYREVLGTQHAGSSVFRHVAASDVPPHPRASAGRIETEDRRQNTAEVPRLCYLVTHSMTTCLLRGQLRYMQSCGFDVTLISSPGKELDQIERAEGVNIACIPMERRSHPLRDLRSLFQLYRLFSALRPDIVNAGTPKAGLLAMLAAFAARVPVRIYTVRGLRLETTRGLQRQLLAIAERATSFCAHRVVCVSHSLAKQFLKHSPSARNKTIVLGGGSSNGVDPERFAPTQQRISEARRIRERLGITPGDPVVGYVGRLACDKGIADLVRAFAHVSKRLPTTWLLLVGEVDRGDSLDETTLAYIRSHPRAITTGFADDVAAYYHSMNVLAFPSFREGFPNAVLEAQAAGVAVVGYRVTGLVDAVIDGVTGRLVSRGDVDALGAALLEYLLEPKLAAAHGVRGRCRARSEFSNQRIWQALRTDYCNLLQAAGRPSPADRTLPSSLKPHAA